MPKQAKPMHWAAVGAAVGSIYYILSPMPGSVSVLANVATGLIGGGLLGGFAAGIRNLLTRK